ncbi:unnamed protein product [Haemonchus placei]|uniref:Secreted protein n=1 Tax=Haemonchus placei TaxID=6290 RepID=A0A0N4WCD4_HAEPC|nr:unnamed protein product [Haemonchus placei]
MRNGIHLLMLIALHDSLLVDAFLNTHFLIPEHQLTNRDPTADLLAQGLLGLPTNYMPMCAYQQYEPPSTSLLASSLSSLPTASLTYSSPVMYVGSAICASSTLEISPILGACCLSYESTERTINRHVRTTYH